MTPEEALTTALRDGCRVGPRVAEYQVPRILDALPDDTALVTVDSLAAVLHTLHPQQDGWVWWDERDVAGFSPDFATAIIQAAKEAKSE